jgi:hypothetical protein
LPSILVPLIALLAHDLLMAVEPVAARAHQEAGHHGEQHPAAETGGTPLPVHGTACGVTQPAAPQIGRLSSAAGDTMAVDHGLVLPPCPASDMAPGASEPTWPPGLRRALLQVYRM